MEKVVRFSPVVAAFLGCLLIPAYPAAAQSTPDGAGRSKEQECAVTGKVTLAGKPAPGITLIAFRQGEYSPIARAGTDEAGRYQLTIPIGGEYNVTVFAPLLVPPKPTSSLSNKSIRIGDGEAADGLDFDLVCGGVITGRIVGPDGQPVIGERVHITRVHENRAEELFAPADQTGAQTDDRGVYRIYGVPPGQYKISVYSYRFRQTYYPGVTDAVRAALVDVESGGDTNINIALATPVKRYDVTGQAVDAATGKPVPGVRFDFRCNEGESAGYMGSGHSTDTEGAFRIQGLAPGRCSIFTSLSEDIGSYSDPLVFEVKDEDVKGLQIKLHPGSVVSGSVIVDRASQPEVLAKVAELKLDAILTSSDPTLVPTRGIPIHLASDGSFRVSGLRPGRLLIGLDEANSPKEFSLVVVESHGSDLQAEGIPIVAGDRVDSVRVVVAYGVGKVLGQLKIKGGSLPPDTILVVSAWPLANPNRPIRTTYVDAGGRFELAGLVDGDYNLVLFGGGLRDYEVQVTVANGEAPFTTINVDLAADRVR